ncbi:hypothetical protein GALL_81940 [mine drainage metagenome]|uniref:Prepilin-type N-terminal cleavage/methylation domain-containing protein n=1 Tax=mine drainage metagenome TaxID=410659 RepID=A0A1J5T7J8_9ZZZZ
MQRTDQLGFTLFEIAIAVAIVCLLASFVVIGQTVTINTKVNRLDRDLNSIRTAIYDAKDSSNPMRGNFRKTSSHSLPDSAGLGDDNNLNTIISGDWKSTSGEIFSLWKKMLPAASGQNTINNSTVYAPLKMPSGMIGVFNPSGPPIAGINGSYIICTDNIAGAVVKRLDFVMDDGNTSSGTMMTSNKIGGTAIATGDISNSATYVICLGV